MHSNVELVEDHFAKTKKDDDINDREVTTSDDDADNILRSKVEVVQQPESPESPISPEFSLGAKYDDQVSVELEPPAAMTEKREDFTLIEQLFGFLDKPPASDDPNEGLNSTLCGYFSKVIQIMISFCPKELMNYFQ
jgi:hypothetical protein